MTNSLQRPIIENISQTDLNDVIKIMIQNDNSIMPTSKVSPKIWYCDWYNVKSNDDKVNYTLYQAGDAVWINTEDVSQFVEANKNKIKNKILNNGVLKSLYEDAKDNDDSLLSLYQDVVTGKVTGNIDNQPLFYLGNHLENTQIRVSLSNDNWHDPSDDAYWADFFVNSNESRFEQILIDRTNELLDTYMKEHLMNYHLSGINSYWKENYNKSFVLSDNYLLEDMSNVQGTYDYINSTNSKYKGIDYVLYFHQHKFSDKCWKWFRVWKSGIIEHGGIVCKDSPALTQDSLVALDADGNPTNYKVNLAWSDSIITAPKFTYSIDSTNFYYDDQKLDIGDKNKIELPDLAKSISQSNHYSILVTPILDDGSQPYSVMYPDKNLTNSIYYDSIDVNQMTNSSFCFNLNSLAKYYSYNVRGYSINSQQYYNVSSK